MFLELLQIDVSHIIDSKVLRSEGIHSHFCSTFKRKSDLNIH